MQFKERNHRFPGVWIAGLILGLLLAFQTGLGDFLFQLTQYKGVDALVLGYTITFISSMVLIVALVMYKGLTRAELFGTGKLPPSALVRLLPPLVLLSLTSSLASDLVTDKLSQLFPPDDLLRELFRLMLGSGLVSFVVVVLFAPLVEELIFRGLLLRSFLTRYSPRRAIFYSALLFALYHLNIYQFPAALVFGLVAGWIYVRTRSLWATIIMHAVVNGAAIASTALFGLDQIFRIPEPLDSPFLVGIALVGTLLAVTWTVAVLRKDAAIAAD